MERRKPPFVGMLVDVVLVAAIGWAIGSLTPHGATPLGYFILLHLAFMLGGVALPLAHEFTGGPHAGSWAAVVSSVVSSLILVGAITVGAANGAGSSFGEAFAAHAYVFSQVFFFWVVVVNGGIALTLLLGKAGKDARE